MYAFRTIWKIRPRRMSDALAYFEKYAQEGLPGNGTFRVYTPRYSPNVLVYEETWESEEAHAKYWEDLNASPGAAAMWDGWFEIAEKSTGTEVWNVREWR